MNPSMYSLGISHNGQNSTNYLKEVENNINPIMATNMGWMIGPSATSFETDYFEYNQITQETFEIMVFLLNLNCRCSEVNQDDHLNLN